MQGRKNIFKHLQQLNPEHKSHIWFHFASLGEFEQGRPVIEAIRKKDPKQAIAISFFSPSGYEIRKNSPLANLICYLPLDTRSNAKHFLNIIRPSVVYFTKYEFWHYYIDEIHQRQIPLYLISGIFRKEQIFFRAYGGFFRAMLKKFNHLFVQNKESEALLHQIGIKNCSISGDTRFDTVYQHTQYAPSMAIAASFKGKHQCIVAGSTWTADEELLLKAHIALPHIKWIIAPHQIDRAHLSALEENLRGLNYCLFSEANLDSVSQYQILVIDNIGMLSSLYQYADLSYVGGGFGAGIHNTLEAIAFGAPVIFGPKHQKFMEAQLLLTEEIAQCVHNSHEFTNAVQAFEENLTAIQQKAREFIKIHTGATAIIMAHTRT